LAIEGELHAFVKIRIELNTLPNGINMSFFKQLSKATETDRNTLMSAPIIGVALKGDMSLDTYVAFLKQAYHHVKHTIPLLMATGARLPEKHEWLRNAVAEYIEEELGHQEWILNDIAACGYDKESVRSSQPHTSTELMVAYAYDTINRINPLGFFGMVHVLEGTSIAIADSAANSIQRSLNLPINAFSYLVSHGALDIEHVKFFENIMNEITDPDEQQQIIHSAKVFYQLYGDIFRSINENHAIPLTSK
jgi:long-chain acyl-CoA synthetase